MDVSDDDGDPLHLRMVLAPNQTPASKLLLKRRLEALPPDAGPHFQQSFDSCRRFTVPNSRTPFAISIPAILSSVYVSIHHVSDVQARSVGIERQRCCYNGLLCTFVPLAT